MAKIAGVTRNLPSSLLQFTWLQQRNNGSPCTCSCSATSITVTDLEGNPVKNVCASKTYSIRVDFPEERLAYVSLNAGKVAATNAANKK